MPPKTIHTQKEDTMNTRLPFITFVIVVVLGVTAWASALFHSYGTANAMVQPAADPALAPAPVADSAALNTVRAPVESRLWSGEIFLNSSNAPDHEAKAETLNNQPSTQQLCSPEESQPRRYGGCVE
jgi:hypothetical protein